MRITPVGDAALRLEFGAVIDATIVRAVHHAASVLERADVPGVVELVPTYAALTVYYDPVRAVTEGAPADAIDSWLGDQLRAALARAGAPPDVAVGRIVEIPVCYGGVFGPDLDRVAVHTGLGADEVVTRHCQPTYLVAMLGFLPGFPYLIGLPPELATPRLGTPRVRVPRGSVGIAAAQTGVYPLDTPGGWNLIGRTPLSLFDPARYPPVGVAAGDRVSFRPITRQQFDAWPIDAAIGGLSS